MEPFGLKLRTGDDCPIAARGTFEILPGGLELLEDFFRRQPSAPARADFAMEPPTVLLPWGAFVELAAFAMLRAGCAMVVLHRDGLYGNEAGDNPVEWSGWMVEQALHIKRLFAPNGGQAL